MIQATHVRAGFALLLVVVTLLVVSALAIGVLTSVSNVQAGSQRQEANHHLINHLQQGESYVLRWLTVHAIDVVFPPEGGPLVVLDERFTTLAGNGALVVDLYDGLAGVPAHLLTGSKDLRWLLPTGLTDIQVPTSAVTGPLQPSDLLERISLRAGMSRFPLPVGGQQRFWNDPLTSALGTPASKNQAYVPSSAGHRQQPSLAEAVSFHSDGPLNVNTAPMPLLDQFYRRYHIGGLAELSKNRTRSVFTNAPQNGAKDGVLLVSQSDSWQCRITVTWNEYHRSWWVVLAGNPGKMKIVQRHEIDD